jgi:hypothetical protein
MWANDTNYTVIKNGVLVVSGTGPAIRVDGNKLVVRDGPKETSPLALTRAEASRKLRHVIMTGTAGGYATFDSAGCETRVSRSRRSIGMAASSFLPAREVATSPISAALKLSCAAA